jgi:hypothetical protein
MTWVDRECANPFRIFRVYSSPKVDQGSAGFHAFGLSPFLPYNAPLCCLKAGNWLYLHGIKVAVYDPVQQRDFYL